MLDCSVLFEANTQPSTLCRGKGFLIRGTRQAGKSSLAFQAAINTVLQNQSVLVLCRESVLYNKVPQPFVSLSSLSEPQLNKIEFIYVDNWVSAVRELMELRTREELPTLIISDDDGFPESTLHFEKNISINKNNEHSEASRNDSSTLNNSNSYLHYTNKDYNSVNTNNNNVFALCLSYLCNMVDWQSRLSTDITNNTKNNNDNNNTTQINLPSLFFIVVSNAWDQCIDTGHDLSLPFRAFPLIDIVFTSPGVMEWDETLPSMLPHASAAHSAETANLTSAASSTQAITDARCSLKNRKVLHLQ